MWTGLILLHFNSTDGKLIAFGSSDLTVGVVDAHTFAVSLYANSASATLTSDISLSAIVDNPKVARLPTHYSEVQPNIRHADIR